MPLKFAVDNLDSIDETQKSFYKEQAGRFYLDVEDAPDVTGLKKALESERGIKGDLEKKLKQFDGIENPEEARKALEALKQNKDKKLIDEADITKAIQEATGKIQKERIEPLEVEKQLITEQLREVLINERLTKELITARVKPGLQTGALLILSQRVDVIKNSNGKYSVVVKGDDGKPRYTPSGNPMTLEEFVKDWSGTPEGKDYVLAAENSGGGTTTTKSGGSGGEFGHIKSKADFKNIRERTVFIEKMGREEFEKLPIKRTGT